jgi:hypothetical protein
MTKSGRILAVATVLGIGLGAVALTSAAFNGSARAVETGQQSEIAAQRIAAAFSALPEEQPAPAIEAAARSVVKGDLLAHRDCAEQRWPDITADCLVGSDGNTVRHVRSVTIGYQTGEATTFLVRTPVPQIAAR